MNPWLPLLYQYGVGGLVLVFGISIALATGGAKWSLREDRLTIIILISGYFFYLAMHSLWIWKATQ